MSLKTDPRAFQQHREGAGSERVSRGACHKDAHVPSNRNPAPKRSVAYLHGMKHQLQAFIVGLLVCVEPVGYKPTAIHGVQRHPGGLSSQPNVRATVRFHLSVRERGLKTRTRWIRCNTTQNLATACRSHTPRNMVGNGKLVLRTPEDRSWAWWNGLLSLVGWRKGSSCRRSQALLVRSQNGVEFATGPNLSASGLAFVFALGYNYTKGDLNLPINIAFVPNKQGPRNSPLGDALNATTYFDSVRIGNRCQD